MTERPGSPSTQDAERPLVDAEGLTRYLDAKLPGEGPFAVERHRAGHSNETFFIRRSGHEWILRRPPRGAFLPTAHDVMREHRVLRALADTQVRTPRPLVACEDEAVIGAPFYVMERVDGIVVRERLPDWASEGERHRIGEELIDALAELHAVDWQAVGLEGWGRPSGYLDRQLKRWSGQLELTMPLTRALPDLEKVGAWLAGNKPESPASTIVHGDYKLDNVVLASDPPARINGILDWEMSTIGDPIADLGYMLSFWREPGDDADRLLSEQLEVTGQPGFPTREELVDRYAKQTGRHVGDVTWYEVLATWKLAILLEGAYARHLSGVTDDPFFALLQKGVPALARRALGVAETA
ncbi:MAG: phosphotransferase family protein [Actinomycetota bacterium]